MKIWILGRGEEERLEEASKVQFCIAETIQVYLMVCR
jgi:hypothetical protein